MFGRLELEWCERKTLLPGWWLEDMRGIRCSAGGTSLQPNTVISIEEETKRIEAWKDWTGLLGLSHAACNLDINLTETNKIFRFGREQTHSQSMGFPCRRGRVYLPKRDEINPRPGGSPFHRSGAAPAPGGCGALACGAANGGPAEGGRPRREPSLVA